MKQQSKYFSFLSMLVLSVMFMDAILEYKPLVMPFGVMMASSFVFPLWFILIDIITEIYGPQSAKRILWSAFICQLIMTCVTAILINQKSPESWSNQPAFDLILGNFPRIILSNFISIILSGFININVLTKWKILLKGKYFWIRSIGSSAIAELLYSTLAVFLIGYNIFTLHQIFTMILWSCIMKLSYSIILATPATFITNFLKSSEGIIDDYTSNPFSKGEKEHVA
jgi:uncharacterized integral membrane protein (TIGR00697 family)